MVALTDELQRIWHNDIPVSKSMAIEVAAWQHDLLTVTAALEPNINVHGTAFAGSLYAVCALCGWGSAWLQMQRQNIVTSIVIAEAHINYFKPVQDRIQARCHFDAAAQAENMTTLLEAGKTRFQLITEVFQDDVVLASFRGSFAVRRAR